MRPLSADEYQLLESVVREHAPALRALLEKIRLRDLLSDDEREALREAIADELGARGIDGEGHINDYGVRLDDLIDRVGHVSEPD